MSTTAQLYALSIDQVVNAILVGGSKRTVLVQGHMGTGKSSILKILAQKLPDHAPCYFDCTTKDLGDISLPNLKTLDAGDYVSFVPNEELGLHLGRPVIIMIDELGKANPAVKNALLRLMLEHKLGNHTLPEGSIVFATTNLGAEGVGDLLLPHARNRITVVSMRKPTNIEHIEYGINNGFDSTLLAWEKDNPQLFATFETITDPEENPYIYHPRAQRAAFITPRSLEAASDWLKQRENFDDQTLTALLIGTIGDRGAMDLMAFVRLADQMPSLDSIKNSPTTARVPDNAGAVCMVVYRALSALERNWIDPWMDYLVRLDKEAQGLFANGVRNPKYSKQSMVMTNKKFTDWALQNNYMFTADKK